MYRKEIALWVIAILLILGGAATYGTRQALETPLCDLREEGL